MVLHYGHDHETVEELRLRQDRERSRYWKRWGPYLSDRQWATVREDYSHDGDAWSHFPHDQARSRVYRWGEDGIAGISDNHQFLCLSFAFWNEKDPFLKERLFGLTGHEGNHGEDVKELYYYLDCTPSHSYMKFLYKYPQTEFPYEKLRQENAHRDRMVSEYELLDTDIFEEDRYFDIFIEIAKDADNEEELLCRLIAFNRGPDPAPLHILPQMWFRNTWAWGREDADKKPTIDTSDSGVAHARHYKLGDRYLQCAASPGVSDDSDDIVPQLLFTDNETNEVKLWGSKKNQHPFVKDGFHDRIVDGKKGRVNPANIGTKVGAWYNFESVPPGDCAVVRFKMTNNKDHGSLDEEAFDNTISKRIEEADEFYWRLNPMPMSDDLRNIQRQSLSGMLWTKQFYCFIWDQWANGDPTQPPPPPDRKNIRNQKWQHMYIDDILSMPDKWEYPFFAVWDTAFHCIPLAMVDPDFAKKQLDILTREWYMHPNGQIPAYEWNFSDVNPPVHAWATFRTFKIERKLYGREDFDFLERVFQKLLLNFTWWVNRKDEEGHNLFEGGFLGLDNIGLFNRSEPLPTGGRLMQADGTAWMGFYCLSMLNIALELAKRRRIYEDIASKFFEHFLFISDAMTFKTGKEDISLWNEEDGFFYDCISWGESWWKQLPVRSLVGLMPLYATLTLEPEVLDRLPSFKKRLQWFVDNRPEIATRNIHSMKKRGKGNRLLLALVNEDRLKRILHRMLDEEEFLSDFGIRSLSKYHAEHPYSMEVNGQEFKVDYVPGDSNSGLFGGNSNWRGPIWLATTFLLIESLQRFYMYYGDNLKIECPTGSGDYMHLGHVAEEIQHRVQHIFVRDENGCRATNGGNARLDFDPQFGNYLHFYEFFHSDSGRGLGASHQLGWTGLVAKLIHDTGITCRLPNTPRTPSAAASHYFDEVFSHKATRRDSQPQKHHLRRRSTNRSIGHRSDLADDETETGTEVGTEVEAVSIATKDDADAEEEVDKKHMMDMVTEKLSKVRSNESLLDDDEFASIYDHL